MKDLPTGGTGVEPDVATIASDALVAAYKLGVTDAKPSLESEELTKERQLALQDLQAALAEDHWISEEVASFSIAFEFV